MACFGVYLDVWLAGKEVGNERLKMEFKGSKMLEDRFDWERWKKDVRPKIPWFRNPSSNARCASPARRVINDDPVHNQMQPAAL